MRKWISSDARESLLYDLGVLSGEAGDVFADLLNKIELLGDPFVGLWEELLNLKERFDQLCKDEVENIREM